MQTLEAKMKNLEKLIACEKFDSEQLKTQAVIILFKDYYQKGLLNDSYLISFLFLLEKIFRMRSK